MTDAAAHATTRAITIEEVVPHAIEKVWHALTSADLIARWLMSNDFKPERGRRFTFQSTPIGDWDGRVACEVLEIDPPGRLKYAWVGGSNTSPNRAHLDSTVTWTLTPVEGGTLVRMVHDGFVSPQNDMSYAAMRQGWGTVLQRIAAVIAVP